MAQTQVGVADTGMDLMEVAVISAAFSAADT